MKEIAQSNLDNWPSCAVDGCSNKSCRALESIFCHPHTVTIELMAALSEFIDIARIIESPTWSNRWDGAVDKALAAMALANDARGAEWVKVRIA